MLKLWWSMTAVAVVLGIAAISAGDAAAQKDDAAKVRLTVDRVDATGDEVVVDGSVVGADPSDIELTVAGKAVDPTSAGALSQVGARNDVIAVLDNGAALGNAKVQLAKDALAPLAPGRGAVSTLGVITTGGKVDIAVGPTASDAAVAAGVEGISPLGASLTWDAVTRAAGLLEDGGAGSVGTVVLFTGAPSSPSGTSAAVAKTALQRAGVRLDVVALPGAPVAELEEMVGDLGGSLLVVDSDEDLGGAFERVAEGLGGRFRLTFPAADDAGEVVPLVLRSGDTTTEIGFTPGAVRYGTIGLAPTSGDSPGGSMFANPVFKWLALLLGVGAIVALVWVVLTMVLPSETNLAGRLEVYEENYGAPDPDEIAADGGSQVTVPILRRAVELTGEIAEHRGFLDRIEVQLERANLPLRAAEAVFFTLVGTIVLAVLAFALSGNVLVGLMAAAAGVMVPMALLNFKVRKRRKAFVAQLPDMLTLLAGTLKAGYSISQGFESVSREIDDPMGRELRRVVTESRLGRPLEEALESIAERMDSDDFAWAVMAIRIQREVGGNLAELLMTVADTMTQRERLRRDVATLTAEGRMSAVIIGLLPPGLAAVLFVMNPEYISELFTPGLGYGLIVAALLMMGIGFAWMKKTITIEV